jgi:hypothetical protein
MSFIILATIFIAEFFTTPHSVLFYDQVEYLRIVSTHSFWQVFSLGHFPIHPIFLGILWITTKFILANQTAFVFGIISTLFVYKISKFVFKKGEYIIPVLIFSLFPIVWAVNTNLMIESVNLALYAAAIYFFLTRKFLAFFVALFLMVGVHLEAISWIPTIFLLPFIFEKEIKIDKKVFIKFIKLSALAIFSSVCFYTAIYYFLRKDLGGSTEHIYAFASFGFLRIIRNVWVSFIRSFGGLTPFVLAVLLLKNVKKKSVWIAWIIFFAVVALVGAYWEGDLMQRRTAFAGVILSLALYKYLKEKSVFIILYLLPIIIANGILYFSGRQDMPLALMQQRINKLPVGQVLIESRYYQPFVKYEGTVLWIGVSDLSKIDDYLNSGKRVFMEKNAITSPYMLFVGNNYHITSLGRVGESESKILFKKYAFDLYGESLELRAIGKNIISAESGNPVIFYNNNFWARLNRYRIDYGDIGSWIWVLVTNYRDPTGWTYKDARGIWLQI